MLGAALILKAGGKAQTQADGVAAATAALESGEARAILERLRSLS